jgi:hypothetical protein
MVHHGRGDIGVPRGDTDRVGEIAATVIQLSEAAGCHVGWIEIVFQTDAHGRRSQWLRQRYDQALPGVLTAARRYSVQAPGPALTDKHARIARRATRHSVRGACSGAWLVDEENWIAHSRSPSFSARPPGAHPAGVHPHVRRRWFPHERLRKVEGRSAFHVGSAG